MDFLQSHITALPDELLLLVFDFHNFDRELPPSIKKFDDEPNFGLTSEGQTPLKTLTLVCKRWRHMLLPRLFAYSRVVLSPIPRWILFSHELLSFCERRIIGYSNASTYEVELVKRVTACLHEREDELKSDDLPIEYCAENDNLLFDATSGSRFWIPSKRGDVSDYLDFIERNRLAQSVLSLTLCCEPAFSRRNKKRDFVTREVRHLWRAVFTAIDLQRIVIVAHPSTMALLTASRRGSKDNWLFQQECHYLEFSREASDVSRTGPLFMQQTLQNMRYWTHLSYNEGSSIPAYRQYEYFLYHAPRILYKVLLRIGTQGDSGIVRRLRSVKYIACFPLADHVDEVLRSCGRLGALRKLETRFSPDPSSNLLDDEHVGRSDRRDCWNEFTQAYQAVSQFMVNMASFEQGNSFQLKVSDYKNSGLESDLDAVLQPSGWRKERDCWMQP